MDRVGRGRMFRRPIERGSEMSGRLLAARRPRFEGCCGRGFFRLDLEEMSGKARAAAALSVLVGVVFSELFLIVFVPALWWVFTIYGWVVFPALRLLVKKGFETPSSRPEPIGAVSKERELLEALRKKGELTAAFAATETSLTVSEADRMLGDLAEGGHLEVRVSGGGIFYSLWEPRPTRSGDAS